MIVRQGQVWKHHNVEHLVTGLNPDWDPSENASFGRITKEVTTWSFQTRETWLGPLGDFLKQFTFSRLRM